MRYHTGLGSNSNRLIDNGRPLLKCGEVVDVLTNLGWQLKHGFNAETGKGKCANMVLMNPATDEPLATLAIPNREGKPLTCTQISAIEEATTVDLAAESYTRESPLAWVMSYDK